MNLLKKALETNLLLYHACKAADNCSDIMLHYYNKEYDVEYDETEFNPGSGLSITDSPGAIKIQPDKYCDTIAREYLKTLYPEYGFVGEESFDPAEMNRDLFWCVDPICGSMGYKKKTDSFGTSVALIKRDAGPFIGVLNCPKLHFSGIASIDQNKTYYSGNYKKYNTNKLKVILSSNRKKNKQQNEMIKILAPEIVTFQESVPVKSLQVLCGTYDLYFNLPSDNGGGALKIWDIAASHVFYKIENMEFVDFDGTELDLTGAVNYKYNNGLIMAKDKKILELCLNAFEQIK